MVRVRSTAVIWVLALCAPTHASEEPSGQPPPQNAAAQSGATPVLNAGVVVYRRAAEGQLTAIWRDATSSGQGIATGDSKQGFPGQYRVRYLDPAGKELAAFDLIISKDDHGFRLTWLRDGAVKFMGVGMLIDEATLAATYERPRQ